MRIRISRRTLRFASPCMPSVFPGRLLFICVVLDALLLGDADTMGGCAACVPLQDNKLTVQLELVLPPELTIEEVCLAFLCISRLYLLCWLRALELIAADG